jgi:hypothetical protein
MLPVIQSPTCSCVYRSLPTVGAGLAVIVTRAGSGSAVIAGAVDEADGTGCELAGALGSCQARIATVKLAIAITVPISQRAPSPTSPSPFCSPTKGRKPLISHVAGMRREVDQTDTVSEALVSGRRGDEAMAG